ncbi:MAG: cupin domain-containing protein [Actinobacteria bacterium]|nr:cupin domain-containing protein [Actinomycetota bacterium]
MSALVQASFDKPEETRNFDPPSSGHLDLVAGGKVGRGTFNPGWRWSVNVKPIAGTELCEQAHVGYMVSGRMTVRAKDGTEVTYGPGDYAEMAPGHDAWVDASETEPCIVIDWTGFTDYAKPAG